MKNLHAINASKRTARRKIKGFANLEGKTLGQFLKDCVWEHICRKHPEIEKKPNQLTIETLLLSQKVEELTHYQSTGEMLSDLGFE